MKRIYLSGKLGKGMYATVDDEDYEKLGQYRWHLDYGYACRAVYDNPTNKRKSRRIWMHRFIMGTPPDLFTDHKNQNKLDNQKHNLRMCTASQNKANANKNLNNKSGYKGVYLMKDRLHTTKKWRAQVTINKKVTWLGYYATPEGAALAYNTAALKHFGEFAYLNSIP